MTVPVKGKKIGLVFCASTGDIEIKGLGSEQRLTGIGQNPPWVPTIVWIYDGAEQKEGSVTLEVKPAAAGETAVAFEGLMSVCRE
jgi:hypothetical protein